MESSSVTKPGKLLKSGMWQRPPCMEAQRGHCGLETLRFGGARVLGCLLRRNADWVYDQPKEKKNISVKKAEKSLKSIENFDSRHGDVEFGVCPADYWY